MKWLNGYVRWFDNVSGIGVVTVPEHPCRNLFVHYSAALWDYKGHKGRDQRPSSAFVRFNSLDRVKVTVFEDSHYNQIDRIAVSEWCSREELLSDLLVQFFEYQGKQVDKRWDDYILNNLIRGCLHEDKSKKHHRF